MSIIIVATCTTLLSPKHTVQIKKKLPFSFRSALHERNGNDCNMIIARGVGSVRALVPYRTVPRTHTIVVLTPVHKVTQYLALC